MQDKLNGLRILVVEDMLLVAEELVDTLESWGCKAVGPAARNAEALSLVEAEPLDGVVLDVNLGDENCFPIAQALRAKGTPFLFLSGYDMPTAFPAEFASVPRLSKPVEPGQLSKLMEKHFCKKDLEADDDGRDR